MKRGSCKISPCLNVVFFQQWTSSQILKHKIKVRCTVFLFLKFLKNQNVKKCVLPLSLSLSEEEEDSSSDEAAALVFRLLAPPPRPLLAPLPLPRPRPRPDEKKV